AVARVALRPPAQLVAASGPVLGGQLRLVEGRAPATARPGEALAVDLLWRAEREPDRDYAIFVHLVDAAGRLVAQHDGEPDGGRFPTSLWTPGEGVTDAHALSLPTDLPAGRYTLLAGAYDRQTGARLSGPGGDTLDLGPIEVR